MKKVAIIGRVNVGKSTLFNTLIEKRKALVSRIPGTTRDRNYDICSWRGQKFILIDTGGIEKVRNKGIEKEIQEQIKIALKEADLILFVVDIRDGILPGDKEAASQFRRSKKPVILVLNKADSPHLRKRAGEFLKLGLGEPVIISALTGSGTGDLLDRVVDQLSKDREIEKQENEILRLAIIGKTNVGKSSLLNAILGEERVIVSEIPHTTREPQDTLIKYKNQPILLVDTVGIRKKAKIKSFLEKEGVRRSLRALKDSEVILFMIEAHQPVTRQDKALASYIVKSEKGIIIVANKCDLLLSKSIGRSHRNSSRNRKQIIKAIDPYSECLRYLRYSFSFFPWAPIIFISAKTGLNVDKVLDLALQIKKEREKEIDQKELDKFFQQFIQSKKARKVRIYSLKQTGIKPPLFTLSVSSKTEIPNSYLKFLEKKLREKFGFIGTPIKVQSKTV
jgi:GTP-binding protein